MNKSDAVLDQLFHNYSDRNPGHSSLNCFRRHEYLPTLEQGTQWAHTDLLLQSVASFGACAGFCSAVLLPPAAELLKYVGGANELTLIVWIVQHPLLCSAQRFVKEHRAAQAESSASPEGLLCSSSASGTRLGKSSGAEVVTVQKAACRLISPIANA